MGNEKVFYTVRGYALQNQDENTLTPSMEDYIEMAYRLEKEKKFVRIGDLAEALNVQPPSASKMVQKLSEMGYFDYERYGIIEFTDLGRKIGQYLLTRHEIIEEMLVMLGVKQNILQDTEKIEHNISDETYRQITLFVRFLQQNPEWMKEFNEFASNS